MIPYAIGDMRVTRETDGRRLYLVADLRTGLEPKRFLLLQDALMYALELSEDKA